MNHFSVVVFASGRGRTLQNLLQRIEEESLPSEVKALVVHRPCNAELIAASHDLPVHHVDAEDRGSCHHLLQELAPDLVVLAGWIRPFPTPASSRHQHPPLTLPKYGGHGMYGRRVHEAVIAAGEQVSGLHHPSGDRKLR